MCGPILLLSSTISERSMIEVDFLEGRFAYDHHKVTKMSKYIGGNGRKINGNPPDNAHMWTEPLNYR